MSIYNKLDMCEYRLDIFSLEVWELFVLLKALYCCCCRSEANREGILATLIARADYLYHSAVVRELVVLFVSLNVLSIKRTCCGFF